jgi:hypothetical protein
VRLHLLHFVRNRRTAYKIVVSKLGGKLTFSVVILVLGRSLWPRGLKRRSAVARLLGLRVLIPSGAWRSLCCECCVLSTRGLCNGPIARPEESYRMCGVSLRVIKFISNPLQLH